MRSRAVGDAGRHHAAVAVRDQHDVAQILHLEHADDVGNLGVEIDRRARGMGPLAKAGIGRRPQLMASGPQQWAHFLPGPGCRPGAMGDDEHRHDCTPLVLSGSATADCPRRVSHARLLRRYVQDAEANLKVRAQGRTGQQGRPGCPRLPFLRHRGMVVSPRPEKFLAGEGLVKLLQVAGAALGIPAAAAGTFAAYQNYFSTDVTCQKLRNNIIATMERSVGPLKPSAACSGRT